MAESKIAEAVALLGLEIGEEFRINKRNHIYWITPHGDVMQWEPGRKLYKVSSFTLRELLENPAQIIKLPWKPKKANAYWYINEYGNVYGYEWHDDPLDLTNYRAGNCFQTKEAAKNAKEKLLKDLRDYYENGGQEKEA